MSCITIVCIPIHQKSHAIGVWTNLKLLRSSQSKESWLKRGMAFKGSSSSMCVESLVGLKAICCLIAPVFVLTDVNECWRYSGRLCAQKCENTPGSYRCSCTAGFSLAFDGKNCEGKLDSLFLWHIENLNATLFRQTVLFFMKNLNHRGEPPGTTSASKGKSSLCTDFGD